MFLGILEIALLATSANTWIPGMRIERQNVTYLGWGWKNSTTKRTQDNFTCPANTNCRIMNITFNGTVWVGLRKGSTHYKTTYALHKATGNITINSQVTINCCQKPIEEYRNCSSKSGKKIQFRANETQILTCVNASEIINRTWWAQDLQFTN